MGLAVGDVVALTYQATYANQQVRYALHYRVSTAGSSTTPELDLDAMAANFASTIGNTLTSTLQAAHIPDFNFDAVSAQRIFPVRTIRMNVLSSFPGTNVDSGLPPNTAAVITKRTLTPGRQGLGSLHLSGTGQSNAVNGEWTSLTIYQNVATQLIATRTIPAVTMTVEPGLSNPVFPPQFFSRLFDCVPQRTIRVMRRRTVRVGI